MTGSTWQRVGGLAGIAFVLLFFANFFTPSTPDVADPTSGLGAAIADESTGHALSIYLGGLAMVAFLIFLGALWTLLRRSEAEPGASIVVLIGGVALAAVDFVGNGVYLALVQASHEGREPDAIRALLELDSAVFVPAGFALAALYAGVALSALPTGSLPRWLGWSAAGFAAIFLVALLGVFSGDDEGGPLGIVFFLALLAQFLWVIAASVVMIGDARRSTQSVRRTVTA
jgi:hypothetical protein